MFGAPDSTKLHRVNNEKLLRIFACLSTLLTSTNALTAIVDEPVTYQHEDESSRELAITAITIKESPLGPG